MIVAAAKNMALSATYNGYYNAAVAVEPVDGTLVNPAEDIVWTVGCENDVYTFSYNGQKIGMGDSFSSMPLGEKNDTWQILPALTEGASYLFNIGREVYMEYYEKNSNWSGYYNNSTEELFALNFYVLSDGEEPTEPSEEPTEPTEPSEEPTEPSEEPTEPSEEPTEPSTEPTEPGALAAGKYVVAAKVGDTYYAMTNTFGKKIKGAVITVADGKVSAEDAAAYVIELAQTAEGWTIKGAEGYLKYDSSTNLGTSEEAYTWVIEEGLNGSWKIGTADAKRAVLFRSADSKGNEYYQFGAYAQSNIKEGGQEYFCVEFLPVDGEVAEPTEPSEEPTEPSEEPTEPSEEPTEPSEEPTEPTEPGALTDGQYVVAAYVDGKYYAMSNVFSSKINGAEITVTDGKVAAADAEGYAVTLTASESGWTIRGAEGYLAWESSTNFTTAADPYYWNIAAGATEGLWSVIASTSLGQSTVRALLFQIRTSTKEYFRFGPYGISNIGENYVEVMLIPVA